MRAVRGLLFGSAIWILAGLWAADASLASAVPVSAALTVGHAAKARPGDAYNQGYRSGFRQGMRDGHADCRKRRMMGSSGRGLSSYTRGFVAGYTAGYTRVCGH